MKPLTTLSLSILMLSIGWAQGAPPERSGASMGKPVKAGNKLSVGDSIMQQPRLAECAIELDASDPIQRALHGLDDHLPRLRSGYDVSTIIDNGPTSNRVDIVLLGDGFTAGELDSYADAVSDIMYDFFLEPPFDAYAGYFNVHRVDVVSNESGVDERDLAIYKDTALDMYYSGNGTYMGINLGKANDAAAYAPAMDQMLAFANSSRYGGTAYYHQELGMQPAHSYASSTITQHEFGHSFGNLGDEYVNNYTAYPGGELWQANLSIYEATEMAALQTKWYRWLDHPDVDTFEGAGYYSEGIYRSSLSSKMRSNGSPYREVNTEQLVRMIYETVDPIDGGTPASTEAYLAGSSFFVTPMQPTDHDLDVQWSVDGTPVAGAASTTFTPDYASLADGLHFVSVEVVDGTTRVRDEGIRDSIMTSTREWIVQGSWPGAPTGLVASAGSASVMVDWNDNPEGDIDYYSVYRATVAGGPFTLIDTTFMSEYEDDSVDAGVTYYYVVTAYAQSHESGYSNEDFGTPGVPMPAIPANLTATAGDTEILLDWDDNSEPNLAGYKLFRAETSGGPYALLNATLLPTSDYVDTGLNNGTTYYYVVLARDTGGNESPVSSEASVAPIDFPPAAPTGVTATAAENGADLAWNANSEADLRDYCIYQSETSGGPYEEVDCDDTTHWYMRGLANGVTYYWVITATDVGSNESDYSVEVSATPDNIYPPDPTSGLVAEARYLSVFLDWDDNEEADLDEYKIYQAQTQGGPWTEIDATDESEFLVSGLTGGVTYYFYVSAVDTAGNESDHDDEVSAIPTDDAPPAAPTGLVATAGDGIVYLDWNDNTEPDLREYRIYISQVSGGPYDEVDSDDPSEFPVGGLTNGITYYFVVTAIDDGGWESPYSNQASAYPHDSGPPAAPSNLVGFPLDGAAFIDWDPNTEPDLREYVLFESLTSGGPYDEVDSDDVTEWFFYNLTNGTTYYYVVAAVDTSNNMSGYSNEVAVTPISNAPPITPRDLEVTNVEEDLIELTWTENPEPGVSYYNVYRATSSGCPYTLAGVSYYGEYEDSVLSPGTTYYHVVTAVNTASTESAYSNEVTATTSMAFLPPTNVTAYAGSDSVTITWVESQHPDVEGYGIYRSTVSGGPYEQWGATQDTEFVDDDVVGGTTYYYVVVSIRNAQEESPYSEEVNATPGGCSVPADCDDGLYCNGAEDCVGGTCVAGAAVDCNDGIACTVDSCNEVTDSCDNIADNGYCDNGAYCDGVETCHVTLGCQAGTAVNCDDGVDCTDDSCNENSDSCDNVPNNANCDNGVFCDGVETCDAALDCQAGSDPCPGDLCRESDDSCVDCLSDADCDDGAFCNGQETCDGDGYCVAGTDPCDGDPCDEVGDVCEGDTVELWLSFKTNTAVPGIGTVTDEDIVAYNPNTGAWSMIFDGSDVGLAALEIGGMAVLPTGDILFTFTAAGSVPGLVGGPSGTTMDDSDVVMFTPISLGSVTAGTFTFYFDGSDVGLTKSGENIDALALTSDGRLIISTTSGVAANGASGKDEDLLIFNDTSLGAATSGSFELFIDGSDIGLATSSYEDIDAAGMTADGSILFSTLGSFSVSGLSGSDEDVAEFIPTSTGSSTAGFFSMFEDLTALGIDAGENVGSLELVE